MRLGYFGGSFDPPHMGHLTVAIAAARAYSLDQVLFVPTGRQPLKPDGPTASFGDRLVMTELLCRDAAVPKAVRLEASALEAPPAGGAPNYTVDTLERLHRQSREDELFVLVGADAFLDLRRWREPDRLIELAEWIVVSRPGVSRKQLDSLKLSAEQRRRIHRLDGIAEPASATRIREALRSGGNCAGLLSPSVLDYIRAHHLYDVAPAALG
jgi:nicotinate-nucleotide adenylyltransferase